jgi:hypothetical protein
VITGAEPPTNRGTGMGYVRPDWRSTLAPPTPSRPQGTLYGGTTGLPTSPNPDAPLELSGSLTGMVLAQGSRAELRPTEQRSRTIKVVLVLCLVLALLAGVGALVAYFSGDILSGLFGR